MEHNTDANWEPINKLIEAETKLKMATFKLHIEILDVVNRTFKSETVDELTSRQILTHIIGDLIYLQSNCK